MGCCESGHNEPFKAGRSINGGFSTCRPNFSKVPRCELPPRCEPPPCRLPPWAQGFESLRSLREASHHRTRGAEGEDEEAVAPEEAEAEGRPPGADALRAYVDRAPLLNELREQRVRLVKPEFLIKQFRETEDPLPSRQGISEDSFVDVDALSEEERQCLEIIAVSYCWLDHDHPDPMRYHLETLVCLIECLYASSFDAACASYTIGGRPVAKSDLRDTFGVTFGAGDGRPVGIFLDWVSLYQDKPQKRTQEQLEVCDAALQNIHLWYAHQATIVWVLNYLSPGTHRPGYHESGWTTFERAVAAILSPSHKLLDITESMRSELVSSRHRAGDYAGLTLRAMDRNRGVPQEPSCFDQMVEDKHFANGADRDAVVKPKYAETFRAVIADTPSLSFTNAGFGDMECRRLMEVARGHCNCLRTLDLSLNAIRMRLPAIAEFAEEQVHLTSLRFSGNMGLAGDVACLATLTRLTELRLGSTLVTGDVRAFSALTQLRNLTLCNTAVMGKLASFAGLLRLAELSLNRTAVSGDLAALAGLAELAELYLTRTPVCGDVAALAGCTELAELGLGQTGVSGDVAALGGHAALVRLGLEGTRVFGDVAALGGLARLEALALYDTSVTGDVASLAGLGQLTTLALTNTGVAGDVGPLAELQNLTGLYLYGTEVTGNLAGLMAQVQKRSAA